MLAEADQDTFAGYVRADGSVGTRNFLGIMTTVNCSATAARQIANRMRYSGILDDFDNVDGVVALTHGLGCGMDPNGEGIEVLRRVMRGYLTHPNFAGFLILGLGCEDNQVKALTNGVELRSDLQVSTGTIQEIGGTKKTVAAGMERLTAMLGVADQARRVAVPASRIVLGTNCGGSDSYSGLTANPALGNAVDRLVRQGGTGIVGETPEIYGAEHLLTRRAVTEEVGRRLLERIDWWRGYTAKNGATMDANPSPGNKAGGITTILEKSLGAVAKGGTTPLADVVEYAEPVRSPGFVFMDTPGYDPVSVTGIVAGGANVVCFTTGPRLGVRVYPGAFDQGGDQLGPVRAHERRHGHQRRPHRRRRRHRRGSRGGDLPGGAVGRLRPGDQERVPGLRRGRVRPLAPRHGHVAELADRAHLARCHPRSS